MLQGETPGFFCVCANLFSSWCRSAQTQVNLESVVCDYFVPVCQNRTTHVMNLLLCNLWHLLCVQLFIIKIGVFVNGYESFIPFWHNSRAVDVRHSDPLQGTFVTLASPWLTWLLVLTCFSFPPPVRTEICSFLVSPPTACKWGVQGADPLRLLGTVWRVWGHQVNSRVTWYPRESQMCRFHRIILKRGVSGVSLKPWRIVNLKTMRFI